MIGSNVDFELLLRSCFFLLSSFGLLSRCRRSCKIALIP